MLLRVKLSVIISHEKCLIIFLICKNLNIHVYNNYILYIYIYIYILYIHNYIYRYIIYVYNNVYMYIKIYIYYILNNIK